MENSVKDFELHLKQQGLSTNSIDSYLYAVKYFLDAVCKIKLEK